MSNGMYEWSSRDLLHRPILLWLVALAAELALVAAMVLLGMYGDP